MTREWRPHEREHGLDRTGRDAVFVPLRMVPRWARRPERVVSRRGSTRHGARHCRARVRSRVRPLFERPRGYGASRRAAPQPGATGRPPTADRMIDRQHVWVGPEATSFEVPCEACVARRDGWSDTYAWSPSVDP